MSITVGSLIVGLVALLGSITSALKFNSPCPDLFHYDSADQPNQWSGTVTLLSDDELHGVWVRLIFDGKLTELLVHDNFGEVVSSADTQEFLIKNRDFVLKPGTPVEVKVTAKYEGDKIPTLSAYRLNAKVVCSLQDTHVGQLFLGDINNEDFLASIKSSQAASAYKEFEGCGTAPLSSNQEPADKKAQNGQWPWQGAIYIRHDSTEKYLCEATLVSSRHVLTPAHCVTYLKSESVVPARRLMVYLGKYSLNRDQENTGVQEFEVEKITMYPGYRSKGLLNDLSIIQLNKPVVVSDYVRPVCLKQSTDKKEGFLVGYAINRDQIEDLAQAKVVTHATQKCKEEDSNLKGLLTDNVICASYTTEDSTCVGDSGSSFVSIREGPKPVWELQGVVTVGIPLQNKYVCNPSSPVFLVDVANYLKWIEANIS